MGRAGVKLPGFCLNRIRPHVRVRSPPSIQSKPASEHEDSNKDAQKKIGTGEEKCAVASGRTIMIVVDSSMEAKGALQWALSHTVQGNDTLMLLHVTKSGRRGGKAANGDCNEETDPRAYQLVQSMKSTCQLKRPEVQVETVVVEGKEKGPTIVEEARKKGAQLLVLGHKKSSVSWRLLMMWAGKRVSGGVVEYCIQNADCMAIAVRRKSKKLGGYLITTKRQKDFWLLA